MTLDLLAKYSNQYVALSGDRSEVIAFDKSFKALEKKLLEMDLKNKEKLNIEFISPIEHYISPLCQ